MIGDPDFAVADLYDMIQPNPGDTRMHAGRQPDRSHVFVIGPDKKVKLDPSPTR